MLAIQDPRWSFSFECPNGRGLAYGTLNAVVEMKKATDSTTTHPVAVVFCQECHEAHTLDLVPVPE